MTCASAVAWSGDAEGFSFNHLLGSAASSAAEAVVLISGSAAGASPVEILPMVGLGVACAGAGVGSAAFISGASLGKPKRVTASGASGSVCKMCPSDPPVTALYIAPCGLPFSSRSEEHTSELQSRQYLVC